MRAPAWRRGPADRLAIRTAFETRLVRIDARDADRTGECLAEDAQFHSTAPGWRPLIGRAAIVENTRSLLAAGVLGRHSQHGITAMAVTVQGRIATSTAFAVVHLAFEGGRLLVRGIGYEDEWVRDGGAWRIRRHLHRPLWQSELRHVDPVLPEGVAGHLRPAEGRCPISALPNI